MNRVRYVPALLLVSLALGCVERKLHIRTEPAGATVAVNGTEIGTTPVEWRFHHFGTVRVTLRKKGFETEQQNVRLKAPWYQYPVADFVSDVLTPAKTKDFHYVSFELVKLERKSEDEIQAEIRALADSALAVQAISREPVIDPDDEKEQETTP